MNVIGPVINLTLNSLIIYYLNNLKNIGCSCAMNYKRDYIMAYSGIIIAMNVLTIGYGGTEKVAGLYIKYPILCGVLAAAVIGSIVNVVFTLQYVEEMKRINCECSESVYRDMMFILSIIQAASLGILILLLAYMGYTIFSISHTGLDELKKSVSKYARKTTKH